MPQVVKQLEAEAIAVMTPRMTHSAHTVWDQAAESIVFDLVRFDSPVAPAHGFIDPNSSFGTTVNKLISRFVSNFTFHFHYIEKCAFVSRNLIQHSPERTDEEFKASNNLDLLKVLETKFVSPRRSSLISRPGSRNSSPLPHDWMDSAGNVFDYEKGLLDASSASLIDDILDYSQGL
jgi:hypothetical protein